MNVLVDTLIWSLFWRRKPDTLSNTEELHSNELERLVLSKQTRIIGPIRQEVLSGIRDEAQFEQLRNDLGKFSDEPLVTEDYEEAARASNVCRRRGVTGSPIDFLICAAAMRRQWSVYTTDGDFVLFARYMPLQLYKLR